MRKSIIALLLVPFLTKAQTGDEAMIKKISDEILRNGKAYDLRRQ
jgi:carboxypeptidase Q